MGIAPASATRMAVRRQSSPRRFGETYDAVDSDQAVSLDGTSSPADAAEIDRAAGHPVRRRRVLYVHGFDPASGARYRRLMLRAATAWAEATDAPVPRFGPVGPLSDHSEGWRVAGETPEGRVETVFEILRYEDIVRAWRDAPAALALFRGLWSWARFAFGGGLWRCAALSIGPATLFFYPVLMLLAFIGLGGAVGANFAETLVPYVGLDHESGRGRALGAATMAAGGALGLWLSYRVERSIFIHLMLSLFDMLVRLGADKPPSGRLEIRMDAFADRIVDAVARAPDTDVDEILIVGHSLGGVVAVQALARAMARDVDLTGGRASVGLLTLGSVGGYIACAGGQGAAAYGDDVTEVASAADLAWVDVSAPRDWFSFGLVDPLLMVPAPPARARSPLVISARFGPHRPDPEDRRTRFRAMSLHMKYLGPPDQPGGFDLFSLIIGPRTLAAAHRDRRPSPRARMLGR